MHLKRDLVDQNTTGRIILNPYITVGTLKVGICLSDLWHLNVVCIHTPLNLIQFNTGKIMKLLSTNYRL